MSDFEIKEYSFTKTPVTFSRSAYGVPNSIFTPGISFGPHLISKHKMTQAPGYEIWHSPTHKGWGGNYQAQNIIPSEYFLVKVLSENTKDDWGKVKFLYRVEPGKYWKAATDQLMALAIKMYREEENEND